MTPEPKYVAETLAWCNRHRAKTGKKPLQKLPKGIQGDPSSCPCGKATGLSVFEWVAEGGSPDKGFFSVPTNRNVNRFVQNFDKGKLPQYIEDGS